MRLQGFHHVAVQVRDLSLAVRFYTGVLGLPEQARHRRPDGSLRSIWLGMPDGGFLALEEVNGEPVQAPFRTSAPGLHLVALRIAPEDRRAVLDELARAGVDVVHQTRWSIYFRDPEGNRVALSHHPHDAPA